MKHSPPKYLLRFFKWFCDPELHSFIEGDLHELFQERVQSVGKTKAEFRFMLDVLLLLRPGIIRSFHLFKSIVSHQLMLKSFLIVALRNFFRNRLYTFLNGLGLILGLSCSLLMLLWVHFERNIDRFHPEGERIYRSYFNGLSDAGEFTFTQGSAPYALYNLLGEYDGVEKAAYYEGGEERMLAYGEEVFTEKGAEGSFSIFEIFDFPLIAGSIENARNNLQTIFISEDLAKKLLGEDWLEESVGSNLLIDDEEEWTVAGVFQNVGHNSSLQFEFVQNVETVAEAYPEWAQDWAEKGATVFAKLPPEVDPRSVERFVNPIYEESNGYGVGGNAMMLFPFEDNYLWTKFEKGIAVGGRIQYIRIFFGAAIFLILIACINFINLSTARASRRAKEVGIRKAVGAHRNHVLVQFLSEAGLLVFLSLVASIIVSLLLLPSVNEITGKTLIIPWQQPGFWLTLLGMGLGLTLLAGLYPAFVLSRYRPARVLKGFGTNQGGNLSLRKSLVVFQFALSAILIISTITVHNQIQLIQHENLGLDRSNVLMVRMAGPVREQFLVLKDKLLQSLDVSQVLRASHAPVDIGSISVGFDWEGKTEDHGDYFFRLSTEPNFDEVFGIEMVEGRFFDENISADSNAIVINETALAQTGLEDPIGKIISRTGSGDRYRILGIMKDFNFKSIHRSIEPLMVHWAPNRARGLLMETAPGQTQGAILHLQETWSDVFPSYSLEFDFLDDTYESMYRNEMIIGKLAYIFAIVAIIISCLGMFGLITFIALQKTKEIGIRKVLGASVSNIVRLLSIDFLRLAVLGLAIAAPIAWYMMDHWLQNFALRTEVVWWVYALTAGILVTAILMTVSYRSVRAALANPAKSLKVD